MAKELTLTDLSNDIHDVMSAVHELATNMDARFKQVDHRLDLVDKRFEQVDKRFMSIDKRFEQMEERFDARFTRIETKMLTREYLDDKIAELRTDLVLFARRGNRKLSELIHELVVQGALSNDVAERILALEPFPQI